MAKGLGSKILGAFIETSDEDIKPEVDTKKKVIVEKEVVETSISSSKTSSGPDAKIVSILKDAIQKKAKDGFDYLKFKNSVKDILDKGDITNEKVAFQTVFSLAKSMGVTVNSLVDNAEYYITVVNDMGNQLEEALSDKLAVIKEKEESFSGIESEIDKRNESIKKLNQEIADLSNEKIDLNKDISNLKSQYDASKSTSDASLNSVLSELKSDKQKIKDYLNGGK